MASTTGRGGAALRTGPPETAGRWALLPDARHRPDPPRPRHRRAAARPARRGDPRRRGERAAARRVRRRLQGALGVRGLRPLPARLLRRRPRRRPVRHRRRDRPAAHLQRGRRPTPSRRRSAWPPPTRPTPTAPRCPGPETASGGPPARPQGRRAGGAGRRRADPLRRARRPHPAHLERRRRPARPRPPASLAEAARRGSLGRLTVERADGAQLLGAGSTPLREALDAAGFVATRGGCG